MSIAVGNHVTMHRLPRLLLLFVVLSSTTIAHVGSLSRAQNCNAYRFGVEAIIAGTERANISVGRQHDALVVGVTRSDSFP